MGRYYMKGAEINKKIISLTALVFLMFGCSTATTVSTSSSSEKLGRNDVRKVAILPFTMLVGKEKVIATPVVLQRSRRERMADFNARKLAANRPVFMVRNRDAAELVTDLFITAFFSTVKADIYDYERIRKSLKEMALDPDEVFSKATPQEIAKIIGVDTVLTGKVLNFGYLKYSNPIFNTSQVSISVNLTSAKTGSLLWSGSKSMTGKGIDLSIWSIPCPSAYELSSKVVSNLVLSFKDSLK